jgi:CcmD family protein
MPAEGQGFRDSAIGCWERTEMKNMNYLVAAYIAIWAIFCVYLISVARRMAGLQDDIRRLKDGGK